ncbi:PREDICTED: uncharacterized protein LOC109240103 [Nicotiana attenuata]|uniref:uncharacterized protein LOC109240103 n=1 Tax=Nicotiana attenuata TaxID=49451 RepID=UPI000904F5D7|nr:PREDICTED: uncharacterized protein LOC109240103 [Nicotiana attenuata]
MLTNFMYIARATQMSIYAGKGHLCWSSNIHKVRKQVKRVSNKMELVQKDLERECKALRVQVSELQSKLDDANQNLDVARTGLAAKDMELREMKEMNILYHDCIVSTARLLTGLKLHAQFDQNEAKLPMLKESH